MFSMDGLVIIAHFISNFVSYIWFDDMIIKPNLF